MERNERPKTLIAVSSKDRKMVSDMLGSPHNAVLCHSFQEAQSQLDSSIKLIVCGVHFDSGRMFDLLRHVKANPETSSIPFYLVLGRSRTYTPAILNAMQTAAASLGATGFINLLELQGKMGKEQANESMVKTFRASIVAAGGGSGA